MSPRTATTAMWPRCANAGPSRPLAARTSAPARRSVQVTVACLTLVGIGSAVSYFFREPANEQFLTYPTIVAAHAVAGALYLALAPLQTHRHLRAAHPGYHRWMGRAVVLAGTAVGMTALFVGVVIPFAGPSEAILIAVFGSLFLFYLLQGVRHVRARRVARHREWMIRAMALALAISTQRLIFVPALMIAGDPSLEQVAALSVATWALALGLHTLAAEAWIRHTRRPPGLSRASRPGSR